MIYVIIGTIGEYIKMLPVMKLFDEDKINYKLILTSQHYDSIEKNRKKFKGKKPDIYLTLKKKNLESALELFLWAPKVLWNARKLKIKKEDWVITHGDTVSTVLALIIGKFFRAKTVHVEAGGRSGKWLEPFPEEILRTIADNFSNVDFCGYDYDAANIKRGVQKYVTHGNTVFDAIKMALKLTPSIMAKRLMETKYVLFMVHRNENTMVKERMKAIIYILEEILKKKLKVVWPLNENTRYELKNKDQWQEIKRLKSQYDLEISEGFDYVDFMYLVKNSQFIAADGGGLQKEAYFLNKPMLVLRKVLEREPGVGENLYLSYLDKEKVDYFLKNYKNFKRVEQIKGSPSKIIVEQMKKFI